jgi:hypothetical protein
VLLGSESDACYIHPLGTCLLSIVNRLIHPRAPEHQRRLPPLLPVTPQFKPTHAATARGGSYKTNGVVSLSVLSSRAAPVMWLSILLCSELNRTGEGGKQYGWARTQQHCIGQETTNISLTAVKTLFDGGAWSSLPASSTLAPRVYSH